MIGWTTCLSMLKAHALIVYDRNLPQDLVVILLKPLAR